MANSVDPDETAGHESSHPDLISFVCHYWQWPILIKWWSGLDFKQMGFFGYFYPVPTHLSLNWVSGFFLWGPFHVYVCKNY